MIEYVLICTQGIISILGALYFDLYDFIMLEVIYIISLLFILAILQVFCSILDKINMIIVSFGDINSAATFSSLMKSTIKIYTLWMLYIVGKICMVIMTIVCVYMYMIMLLGELLGLQVK